MRLEHNSYGGFLMRNSTSPLDEGVAARLRPLPVTAVNANDLYLVETPEGTRVLKHYKGKEYCRRQARERALLQLWHRHRLDVPEMHDLALPGLPQPHLVMSFVSGQNLGQQLRSDTCDHSAKLDMLRRVYQAMRHRHELALATGDLRLIQPDSNTGNVILCEGRVVWIDLECESRFTNVVDCAAAEVGKFTRWAACDLSINALDTLDSLSTLDALDTVCGILREAYDGRENFLEYARRRTTERPFQFWHRRRAHWRAHWRARRRSQRCSESTPSDVVTIPDVVEAIGRALVDVDRREWPSSLSKLRAMVAADNQYIEWLHLPLPKADNADLRIFPASQDASPTTQSETQQKHRAA